MGRRGLLCRCLRREKADGRFFDDADERAGAKVGVLGATLAAKLFGKAAGLCASKRKGVGALTSSRFYNPRPQALFLLALFTILIQALLGRALAEVHVTGERNAIAIEAREASVEELLSALSETYDLHYRVSAGLDVPISGSFAGPLPQVLARVLQRYDFAIETSANGVSVAVYGASGSHEKRFDLSRVVSGPSNSFPSTHVFVPMHRPGPGEQRRAQKMNAANASPMHRTPDPE